MSPNDTHLLQRWVLRRDADAFKELITQYAGLVHGTCRRVLGNTKDAEDVTQECFLRLAKRPPEEHGPLGGWLHRVATNLSIDTLRKDASRSQREAAYAASRPAEEEIEWRDVEDLVDEAIEGLPDDLRRAVVGHYLEGQTHSLIALDAGVSQQAVSYRVKKGIEMLRETLKKRGVPIGAVALASFLESRLSEAAPVALVATLVKLGMSGISSGTAAPSAAGGGLAFAGKVLAGLAILAGLVFGAGFLMNGEDAPVSLERPATPAVAVGEGEEEGAAEVEEALAAEPLDTDETTVAALYETEAELKGALAEEKDAGDEGEGPVASGIVIDADVRRPIPGVVVRIEVAGSHTATIVKSDVLPRVGEELKRALEFIRDDVARSPGAQLDPSGYGVHVKIESSSDVITSVVTDDDGNFELPDLPAGEYVATVQSTSFVSWGGVPVEVIPYGTVAIDAGAFFTVFEGQPPTGLEVRVSPYASVSGRAYDVLANVGVGDVVIQAVRGTNNPRVQTLEDEVRTDALGFFHMDRLRPGVYEFIRTEIEGYMGKRSLVQERNLVPESRAENVDFPLSPGGILTGTVYVGGKPFPNSQIELMFISIEDDFLKNNAGTAPLVDHPVQTDETGQYVVSGVRSVNGGITGLLRTEGGHTRNSELVYTTILEDEMNVVDLEFAWGACSIEGRVHAENDEPIRRATIVYVYQKTAGGNFRTMTDGDGRFFMNGLEAGDARIYIYSPVAYDAKVIPFTLEDGEKRELDVYMPHEAVTCSFKNIPENTTQVWVRVYDPDWTLDLRGPPVETFIKNRMHMVSTSMLMSGRSQLLGLGPGTYTIEAVAYVAAAEIGWFLNEEEEEQFLSECRTLITTLTVEEGQTNVQLELDFAESSSSLDYARGVVR